MSFTTRNAQWLIGSFGSCDLLNTKISMLSRVNFGFITTLKASLLIPISTPGSYLQYLYTHNYIVWLNDIMEPG